MASQAKVEGARELSATTRRAAQRLGNMTAAHSRAGNLLAQQARGRAPVRTGRLAASIRPDTTPDGATVIAGVVYAPPIHWGWPARNIRAQPFLVDTLTAAETSVQNIYRDQVRTVVASIHGK